MKSSRLILIAALCALAVTGCDQKQNKKVILSDKTDTINYLVGSALAKDVKERPYFRDETYATKYDIREEMILAGLKDGLNKNVIENDSAFIKFIRDFSLNVQKEQYVELKKEYQNNLDEGKKFLNEIKDKEGVYAMSVEVNENNQPQTYTMYYKVLKPGTGKKATLDNKITADYTVYTIDQKQRMTSKDASPAAFYVRDINTLGLKAIVQQMNKGAQYRCFIPAELAYQDQLNIPVPLGSTVIVDIEIHDIQ
ncbi:MAG: FKBP-type peptidyl-prolyl cis-trans isomerase [Bacteroidales bacterium]|nr:FKBP-type peptidyl-prolyl cis-trans isomerase [Bacteroidales bacterium]MBR5651937.1 FKBP-type peptidyl-prolyl cis-trans isomerase [Bacteroidales bacterium]MBR5719791.1 FKBP-type peptidyl-prolyl cis-trans isomerase [Bacteroidales bacterium]